MINNVKYIFLICIGFFFLCTTNRINAQENIEIDTAQKTSLFNKIYNYFSSSNKQKNKKFDISLIGGPHYSSDVKLGLGVVAAGLYRSTIDTTTPLSTLSLYGDITTSGFFLIGVNGINIFKSEKYRLTYNANFYSFPSKIWGFGYNNGNNSSNESSYLRIQTHVSSNLQIKIAENFYAGPTIEFIFIKGSKFSNKEYYSNIDHITRGYGIGGAIIYDSRDFIPNAYRGLYIKISQENFTNFDSKPFYKSSFISDYYFNIWDNAILALDLYTEFNYGATPWTMLATLGGTSRMRGYYDGRYRDNNMVEIQAELRQKIYNRHGIALWCGAGNVFGDYSPFKWAHTLPNYGIGYRWEFKKRINVRLDYGLGKKGQSAFIFSIEEAF